MTEQSDTMPVVVGVDGSQPSHHALEWAAYEARERGATLRVVHGFAAARVGVGQEPKIRAAAQHIADDAAEHARQLTEDAIEVRAAIAEGPPAKTLVGESQQATLLVVGSRGRGGFTGLLLGSTSVHVAAHAACRVAVVPGIEAQPPVDGGLVLVGVDAAPYSDQALQFAFERAHARGTGLVALHAWQMPVDYSAYTPSSPLPAESEAMERDTRARLAGAVAAWEGRYPQVPVERRLVHGHPIWELAEASRGGVDVVVVGSRGRGTVTGMMLGSVSQGVLRHARRPVIVAR